RGFAGAVSTGGTAPRPGGGSGERAFGDQTPPDQRRRGFEHGLRRRRGSLRQNAPGEPAERGVPGRNRFVPRRAPRRRRAAVAPRAVFRRKNAKRPAVSAMAQNIVPVSVRPNREPRPSSGVTVHDTIRGPRSLEP